MEEYKSNSHKSKQAQTDTGQTKKVEKVISGEVVPQKKSAVQKLAEALVSEDISSVRSYILTDILIPSAKKAAFDIVSNCADMMKNGAETILYGKNSRTHKNSIIQEVSYRNYYSRRSDPPGKNIQPAEKKYNYRNFIFKNRGDAEEVLLKMDELIQVYGLVRVGDLYDMIGVSGDYTDNDYGWTSIRTAETIRVRDGYILKLPKAVPLD